MNPNALMAAREIDRFAARPSVEDMAVVIQKVCCHPEDASVSARGPVNAGIAWIARLYLAAVTVLASSVAILALLVVVPLILGIWVFTRGKPADVEDYDPFQ